VVHHGLWVVHAHNALGRLLHALRRVPGVVDVLGREAFQDWNVASERGRGLRTRLVFVSAVVRKIQNLRFIVFLCFVVNRFCDI
jgi:hypothetical protein